MESTNTQPTGTPEASTPISTPTSSTPASTPVVPSQGGSKKDNTKSIIIIVVIVVALAALSFIATSISKSSAQKRLDETISICEKNGLSSQECKDSQKKNDVTCIGFKCEVKYHKFIFF